jgi:hypothetical protein
MHVLAPEEVAQSGAWPVSAVEASALIVAVANDLVEAASSRLNDLLTHH